MGVSSLRTRFRIHDDTLVILCRFHAKNTLCASAIVCIVTRVPDSCNVLLKYIDTDLICSRVFARIATSNTRSKTSSRFINKN